MEKFQVIFCFSLNDTVLNYRMAKEVKKIRKKLDHASEDSSIFSLLHQRADGEQSSDQDVFDETAIIGRDDDKENLKALLLDSQEKFSIIPIVGLAGLGKTTLAKLIFSDQDERYNFDLRIWINLNMSYDLNSIASAIISEANRTKQGTSEVNVECQDNSQIIMNCLREVLYDKKCLIILDGLWNTDEGQLVHLKKLLSGSQKDTKIIVTTCSENVAKLMQTVRPYKLGPLSEDNCWTIFCRKVGDVGGNSDITRIKEQLMNSCQGIPAVVHSLSSLMCGKDMSVCDVKELELWKLERQFSLQISMFSSMKKIYYSMPSALKSCISYLSLFPKGFDIPMENLIRQWAALGILGSAHRTMPIYAQGKKYIQELFSIFFLEAASQSSGSGLNQARESKVLNLHNLVHEFARYIASHDLFLLDGERTHERTHGSTSRYALLTRCNEQSKIPNFCLRSVRAICLKNCHGIKFIENVFSALRHLRVLDLSRCSFRELPSSICQLTHLRYIDLSSSTIQSLPNQMSFLQNLETLDLSETCIQVLPDFVGTFHRLKYLSVQGCCQLHHFASKLDDIKSMQHLNLSCCPAAHQLLESISGFQELRFLDISSCTELQALPESFGRLTNLEDLVLSNCSELKIIPESFGELCFLQFLNLSSCCQLEQVPASLGKLANLEVLILSGCSRIQNLPQSFSEIAFLRILDLAGCVDLHLNFAMLPNSSLEKLNVDGCRKICAVPGWTVNFPKLNPECLKNCEHQIRCLITDKQVCPSQDEIEIISELSVHVHNEAGDVMANPSCQQSGTSEWTTKKVIKDLSASANVPHQHCPTATGFRHKLSRAFWGPSNIKITKMSRCFMYGTDMKQNIEGGNNVKIFSYSEMRKATNDFSPANKIGEGYSGLFRGKLEDGRVVAVKVLPAISRQGVREFTTKLTEISSIVHENLITLVGWCAEGSHRILIYNYLENSSLAHTLLGSGSSKIQFNWRDRVKIIVGVARGLAFLHNGIHPHIVHRNINASNILLDKDLTPKVCGFEVANFFPPVTDVSTGHARTLGYLAPEYAIRGHVTRKCDVYSFGVLLLEIVSGRCHHDDELPKARPFLLDRTWTYYEQGKLEQIIDEEIGDDLDIEEACRFLKVGLLCTQDSTRLRPNMTKIINMLVGEEDINMNKVTKSSVSSLQYSSKKTVFQQEKERAYRTYFNATPQAPGIQNSNLQNKLKHTRSSETHHDETFAPYT